MPPVIVYVAGPTCQPCRLTKKHLDTRNIPYTERPLDDIRDKAEAQGITAAPVVQVGPQLWGGYRPDRIDMLTK